MLYECLAIGIDDYFNNDIIFFFRFAESFVQLKAASMERSSMAIIAIVCISMGLAGSTRMNLVM